MNKLILYISVLSALVFSSCSDDFLNTKSPSKQTPDNIYNSLSLTNNELLGAYNSLLTSLYTGNTVLYWQGNTDIETTYRGFNVDAYKSTAVDGFGNYFHSSQNTLDKWENFYYSIEQASNVVEGIRKSPLLATYPAEMKCYLGEALTIRAMVYFHLVKFYGDVPFREGVTSTDLSNVYNGRTDRDTIYSHIIKDLQEAITYLPYLGASAGTVKCSTPERITKAYAKGLLARIALTAGGWSLRDGNNYPKTDQQIEKSTTIPESNGFYTGRVVEPVRKAYYEIAAQQCADLIGDPNNPHKLDPSYQDIWKTVCQLQTNAYNENLYQVAYGMAQNGDVLGNLMGYATAGNDQWGRRMNGGYCISSGYYFYSFDAQDTRRDVALVTASWQSTNKETVTASPVSINMGKWRIYWMPSAYIALNQSGTEGRIPNGIDWIDMRFSDIYLMYAEAMNELYGPDGDASSQPQIAAKMTPKQALEKVRERAFGTGSAKITAYDGSSKEAFFNSIVNERAWEFGAEGLRKSDLIRWGLLSDKIEKMKLALCKLMADQDVQIFDKTYSAGTLPITLYYKYKDAQYVDPASIDYYTRTVPSGTGYTTAGWFVSAKNVSKNAPGILLSSTGLNMYHSTDYATFLTQDLGVTDTTAINSLVTRLPYARNSVCNNRYIVPTYVNEISISRGTLSNSYGY
jgi:SusD family.